jgi:hypothetical protein
MLSLCAPPIRLCQEWSRRQVLQVGSLGLLGLGLPDLLQAQASGPRSRSTRPIKHAAQGKARACILLFLTGGPPQHSLWDPKPEAPEEVRGEFGCIPTTVPGVQIGELMPRTAQLCHKICLLRAVSTQDHAHSSSGYYMLTGQPHQPMNFENANPGPPNDYPSLGGIVRRLRGHDAAGLPAAVTLPQRIFNTDGSVWPGQTAGFLGRQADPWLLQCLPHAPDFRIETFHLPQDLSDDRFRARHRLLRQLDQEFRRLERTGAWQLYDRSTQAAVELLGSASRQAFRLDLEPAKLRDRYGRHPFGQSCLLARRLVEAGVALVQVNWYRGPEEPPDAPVWDTHWHEPKRLKQHLVPPMDAAYSALLEDLDQRGLLDQTLVVWAAEFGRTPRLVRDRAGRDHWGHVFSVALAGGGVRGGQVIGASDKHAAYPREGMVRPQDLTATILHCLGYEPETEIRDTLDRPLPISRGSVITQALA